MLTLYCDREPENMLHSAQAYFNYSFMPEWFSDPMVKEMGLDVDKTEIISALQCVSPIFGPMASTQLSGGLKGLILIKHDEERRNFKSTIFGGNCAIWIARLSHIVDFGLYMCHPLEFNTGGELYGPSLGNTPMCAKSETGQPITTCGEAFLYYVEHH